MLTVTNLAISDRPPARHHLPPAETGFYSGYDWSLDPHLVVSDAIERLHGEINRLAATPAGWQTREVTMNVYLLSSSLLNGIDEYLRGHTLRLPAQLAKTRPGRFALWVTEKAAESLRRRNLTQVFRWRERWQDSLDGFLAILARCDDDPVSFAHSAASLSAILGSPLPSSLLSVRLAVPSAFSRLDLTDVDVLDLGREFMRQYSDRSHQILFLGLRTAGTYSSALLRAFLKAEGYQRVTSLTLHPMKGPSRRERDELSRYAKQGFTLVILDDPPSSGGAIVIAAEIARQAGFDVARIKALVPTHEATRNWVNKLPDNLVITLAPERCRKRQLLEAGKVGSRLAEYYAAQEFSDIQVVVSLRAEQLNGEVSNASNGERGASLRRIFEVQLRTPQGKHETRFVLAKSVGLGYLGYPAFLAADRLSDFVPPVLGLREGILYSEWLPQQQGAVDFRSDRDSWIDTAAAYVAARTRLLGLPKRRTPGKAVRENGWALLAEALGRAYGTFILDIPMRSWIEHRLYRLHCPFPTVIDGNMDHARWIDGKSGPLKTGYYGHGLGKTRLNAIDPAYDLAQTILSFSLSPEEEDRLIGRYVEQSGDIEVRQRLFINKLLAGLWAMDSAQERLFGISQSSQQRQELHRRFLGAWDFLTIQTARFCGARCRRSRPASWRSPLVMLDIDGVLDRRIFGYPCTTTAGMEALSLLATHECSAALNTARSICEVKDYCEAYGLAGGVAENGAYLWDAVARLGRPVIDPEAMVQLDELRKKLRRIPGVFLDERHRYSIRAYTIEKRPRSLLLRMRSSSVGHGAAIPLPTLLVNHLITTLRLDRLSFHQTTIDTAIVAKGVDKGTGLTALRDWVLGPDAETIAIGDTEPDLPMFRAATRSFAPAQVSCRREARLLGCAISRYRYQQGLLDIVRTIVGPSRVRSEPANRSDGERLFLDLLQSADHLNVRAFVRALFDRATFRIFMR